MPRAGVTPDRIDRVAGDIADQDGLSALTMSSVAARLGVSVPSLYKHVDGLDGMRRRLTLRSLDELGDQVTSAAVGKSRDDALAAVCDATGNTQFAILDAMPQPWRHRSQETPTTRRARPEC